MNSIGSKDERLRMRARDRRPAWWMVVLVMAVGLAGIVPAAAPASASQARNAAQAEVVASSGSAQLTEAVLVSPANPQPADPVLARRIAQVSRYVHVTGGEASLDPAIYSDPHVDAATRTWAAQRVAAYPHLYRLVHASSAIPGSTAGRTSSAVHTAPQAGACVILVQVYWWGGAYFLMDSCAAHQVAGYLTAGLALTALLQSYGVPAYLTAPFAAYLTAYAAIFNSEAGACPNGVQGWMIGIIAAPWCA